MLDIRLLGRFSVTQDGHPIAIASRPGRLLLAYLLLHATAPQPREKIADVLWPASSAANARANLRHALWQLCAAIDPQPAGRPAYIIRTRTDIGFNHASAYTLDVAALTQERSVWTTADLLAAASAYDGELLPGYQEPWVVATREWLEVVYDRRMAQLLDRLMAEERWDDTLLWAERWLAGSPLSEPAYRAQMRAYAAFGDGGRVMAAYRRCHDLLAAELGIAPSRETQQLLAGLTGYGRG